MAPSLFLSFVGQVCVKDECSVCHLEGRVSACCVDEREEKESIRVSAWWQAGREIIQWLETKQLGE